MAAIHDFTPPAAFPFLRSEGTYREVGRSHGRAFGDQVLQAIRIYRDKFEQAGVSWERALEMAAPAGARMRSYDASLADELDGIAEGAEVDPRAIIALNMRTSLIRMEAPTLSVAEDHECTTTAVVGGITANGHTLMGQNWDQSGVLQPITVVIEQHVEGEHALLFVTEAGSLFRHGMNDAGVGICGNALKSDRANRYDVAGLSGFSRRRALRHDNLAEAEAALRETPHSTSGNHLMADSNGNAVDLEIVPDEVFDLRPEDGILAHSNHFQHPRAVSSLRDLQSSQCSFYRDGRVRDALGARRGAITVDDVKAALHDHHGYPLSVCRHPNPGAEEIGYTLASTIMDLTERRMWTAPGPACLGTYTEYSFS